MTPSSRASPCSGPTAPLRLATICLDDDGVRRRLHEWHPALQQALDRVAGRMEWSVKAFAPVRPAAPAEAGSAPPTSGADYLRRKKTQTEARYDAEEVAARAATEVHELLAQASVASRILPAQDPRLTGHEGTMLLNGAYLVATADEGTFTDQVRAVQEAHPELGVTCGGPWPPYSFAVLEQG